MNHLRVCVSLHDFPYFSSKRFVMRKETFLYKARADLNKGQGFFHFSKAEGWTENWDINFWGCWHPARHYINDNDENYGDNQDIDDNDDNKDNHDDNDDHDYNKVNN